VRWVFALVSGPSMVPTLRDGDRVLARRGAPVRPGDLVLARYADLDHLVVKRAVRPEGTGWWLESDNPYAGGGSTTHGPGDVQARVICRYWPPRRSSS
jgi:phage repressor protein C with HTH and peptisase S24 domain